MGLPQPGTEIAQFPARRRSEYGPSSVSIFAHIPSSGILIVYVLGAVGYIYSVAIWARGNFGAPRWPVS